MKKTRHQRRRSRLWRRFALFIASCWITLSLWQAPVVFTRSSTDFLNSPIKGVWMTHVGAALTYYATRTDEVMASLAMNHLNTLYPCVWNRGYTLHPSNIAKSAGGRKKEIVTDIPLLPGDDVLAGLVRQAHRQHLRILPWFEYGLMIPESSAIAQAHPDWLTTTFNGDRVQNPLKPDSRLPGPLQNFQLELAGGNLAWLNPFHPDVQTFLTDLIVEVVDNYPVDGIQLDDHFGLPVAFGYDDYTVEQYKAAHSGSAPPTDETNPEWIAWRADGITQLLEKINTAVKQTNPKAIVSVSPNPPGFAYNKYLQDWRAWVDLTLVDEVIVQVYRNDLAVFENDLYNSGFYDLRDRIPVAIGLYTGPFLKEKSVEVLTREIQTVQSAGYDGVAFFCWKTTLKQFKGLSVLLSWATEAEEISASL